MSRRQTRKGRVRGTLVSVSVGTESRFWYVDAGWRRLRMRSTYTEVNDFALHQPRDVFANVGQVEVLSPESSALSPEP